MVAGKRASEQEKKYIKENEDTMCFTEIALNLGELYPLDNAGSRERQFVRHWARKLRDKGPV